MSGTSITNFISQSNVIFATLNGRISSLKNRIANHLSYITLMQVLALYTYKHLPIICAMKRTMYKNIDKV